MARRHPLAGGQTPGWGQPFPGWEPLHDPGPLPLRAAGSLRRWWWPTTAVVGFLAVVGYVFGHDDSRPGLSNRSWLTLVLAAAVVMLLTVHRASRGRPPRAPLARALAEYAVVALLAALLATAGTGHPSAGHAEDGAGRHQSTERPAHRRPPAEQADAGTADRRPGIVRVVSGVWGWLADVWHTADQQTDPRPSPTSTTTPEPSARALPPCPTDLEVPPLMWSSLPSNLRTVLGTALLLGIGVAAAAFTLSFFALRDAAADPALRWGQGHAWLFPIGVDMALVFFEVLLLGASMVRVQERGKVVQYPRAIPFLLVLVAAAGTLYFNATHVPEQVRPIALAVPVASILVTLGLAYLLKMLAAASGVEAIHLAPPAVEPHRIVRNADVLHGELVRDPEVPGDTPGRYGPAGGWGQMLSWAPSQLGQNGQQMAGDGELPEATKRHQVEAYLATLGSEQLGRLTSLGPRAAARELTGVLNGQGVQVSERYVQQILDDWTAATRPQANRRRRR